jgi:hypothetical protein
MRAKAMSKRVFIGWCIPLTALWIFANWPRTYGIAGCFSGAGFPLEFAWGIGGFQNFDIIAFLVEIPGGVAAILGVSWLCAWSRRKTGKIKCQPPAKSSQD